MRRDCEWVDTLEDGTRRRIRVCFPGGGKITWMCLDDGQEGWNRDMTPSEEEWDYLEKKVRARYNRRRASIKDVDLVVSLRALETSGAKPPAGGTPCP
jgi:hypothetical protein